MINLRRKIGSLRFGRTPSALQTEIEPLSCESGLENRRRRAVFQLNETMTDFNYLIIRLSEGVIIVKKDKKIRPRITKGLVDICNEYAVDYALAEQYINNHILTPQEVTYAAICLVQLNQDEYQFAHWDDIMDENYIYKTDNFDKTFELFFRYGLMPDEIFTGETYPENLIGEIRAIFNGTVSAELLNMVYEHGGDPNLEINGKKFFEVLDSDIVSDIDLGYYYDDYYRPNFDSLFAVWLVSMSYGGIVPGERIPVKLENGYTVSDFRDFKRFTHKLEETLHDWHLHIIDRENGLVAGTV